VKIKAYWIRKNYGLYKTLLMLICLIFAKMP
jgi:hypothetical protein